MINISAYLKMQPSIWYGRLHFRGKGRFIPDTSGSMEKQVTEPNSGDYAYQIGNETRHNSVSRVFDPDGPEVKRNDIERRIGRSLENTHQPSHKRIGAEFLHRVDHQRTRAAAAEGLHERYR
jgi:hypothetical protein